MKPRKYKIAFVTSSPSWHQPELFEKISSHSSIDFVVYFCSKDALNGKVISSAFDVKEKNWGQDLLKGYDYKFLKNYSFIQPEFNKTKFFSYINWGIWKEIKKGNYNAIVITLWNNLTCWITLFACKVFNTPVLFLGDSTLLTEEIKPLWFRKIKEFILGKLLFPYASGFLYLNKANRQFYIHYGTPKERLFFYPYSVDFETYNKLRPNLVSKKKEMRLANKIYENELVILFVGRLTDVKRPLDLVKAFIKVKTEKKTLIFMGDGKLRTDIEQFIYKKKLSNVRILGFKPRMEILQFYVMADLLVLPSSFEPHGLVINEAMCFGLPVIASNKVGASFDLIRHNENGYVYPCGDIDKLAYYIDELSYKDKRLSFGQKSIEIVKDWDHNNAVNGLVNALTCLHNSKS